MSMKTVVAANQKGGVGKSAVVTQLARYLASIGLRTLVLDFDHQKNTTRPLQKSGVAVVAPFTATQLLLGQATTVPDGSLVLVPGDDSLSTLERQPDKQNGMVNALKEFLVKVADQFDVCIIDTNPNPDIRYAAAIITSNYVLSPVQLNQEAIDGIGSLLNHARYGFHNIKLKLNPSLELIGLLPNIVEPTPFQKANFSAIAASYASLLIKTDVEGMPFAFIAKRTAIPEAQAEGSFLADVKKTSAREAWREIKPSFDAIARRMQLKV